MSLVNKVLRDLDARRAGEGERAALPAAVTPLAARLDRPARWPRVFLGAIAVAAVLGVAVSNVQDFLPRETPAAPPTQLVPPTQPQAAPAVPTASAPPVDVVAATPAASVASSSATPVPAHEVSTSAAVSSLRLSDELRRVPEPKSRAPVAGTLSQAVPKLAQARATASMPAGQTPPMQQAAPAENAASPARGVRAQESTVGMRVEKQESKPTPAEVADASFRRGVAAARQGNATLAASLYRQAIDQHPEHAAARQALVSALLDARQYDEAEELLRRGIDMPSARMVSVLALARLKVEKGEAPAALDLLLRNAGAGERSAEYQGFLGALLNRAGRSGEAIERYQLATRLAPAEARWWVGLGISLEAGGRAAEGREAYLKARSLPGLPADLVQHVEQRLR